MSKEEYVQLEAVREALQKVVADEDTIAEVLSILNENTVAVDETKPEDVVEPEGTDSEEEDVPKIKKQFGILISDKDGVIKNDLVGWVFQIPENEDVRSVVELIKKGAYNYNASKKGRRYPVGSIGASIEGCGSKFFKPYNLSFKTKEPVLVVTTNNVLPKS